MYTIARNERKRFGAAQFRDRSLPVNQTKVANPDDIALAVGTLDDPTVITHVITMEWKVGGSGSDIGTSLSVKQTRERW
jgi:hypothetical protein